MRETRFFGRQASAPNQGVELYGPPNALVSTVEIAPSRQPHRHMAMFSFGPIAKFAHLGSRCETPCHQIGAMASRAACAAAGRGPKVGMANPAPSSGIRTAITRARRGMVQISLNRLGHPGCLYCATGNHCMIAASRRGADSMSLCYGLHKAYAQRPRNDHAIGPSAPTRVPTRLRKCMWNCLRCWGVQPWCGCGPCRMARRLCGAGVLHHAVPHGVKESDMPSDAAVDPDAESRRGGLRGGVSATFDVTGERYQGVGHQPADDPRDSGPVGGHRPGHDPQRPHPAGPRAGTDTTSRGTGTWTRAKSRWASRPSSCATPAPRTWRHTAMSGSRRWAATAPWDASLVDVKDYR